MKNFYFFILFLLINIFLSKDNNDLLVIKFKTINEPKLDGKSEYNSSTFVDSYIESKVYLELEAGNEYDFKNGKNQILKTFINSKGDIFTFRDYNKKYNSICNYNTHLSSGYKVKILSSDYCECNQTFKINTNIEMNKYLFSDFFIENYFCLNDSLCSEVGINIQTSPKSIHHNFINQLHKILNSSEQNFCLNYLKLENEEGIFTYGLMPHNYSDKYKENNMISFYSQKDTFSIIFDTFALNGSEYFKDEEQYDYKVKLELSMDKEGIIFDYYFFDILLKIFFEPYMKKNICKISNEQFTYRLIFCYDNGFGINDIKKFPAIDFVKYNINFNITFTGEELFYYRDHKYFCKIYCKYNNYKTFTFGRMLLKKYLTVFNIDKKQIYFYKNELKKEEVKEVKEKSFLQKYGIIILVSIIVFIIIVYLFGILTGKIIFKKRKKIANELNDNYEYKANNTDDNNENNVDPLFNQKEDNE